MQSLATFFEDNKPLAYAATVAAIIVLIAVVYILYRLLFGRRLRTAVGGRARQPRLGIVDAYDLDRQRQLVLVRRDNVEHLIMIGGPTDVVIESAIVRTQAVTSARDKESAGPGIGTLPAAPNANGNTLPAPVAAAPLAGPVSAPRTEPSLGMPVPVAAERGSSRPQPAIDPTVPPLAETAPQTARATAPLGRAVPQPPRSQATATLPPTPPPPTPTVAPGPNAAPPTGRPALPPRPLSRPPLPPRPSLASGLPPRPIRPLPSRAEPPLVNTAPVPPPGPEGAPAVQGTPAPENDAASTANLGLRPGTDSEQRAAASDASPRPAKGMETLESLEEEMAKLLGRPAPRRED